jgi:hypothetical protein
VDPAVVVAGVAGKVVIQWVGVVSASAPSLLTKGTNRVSSAPNMIRLSHVR